jgi:hypothetical protein
MVTSAAIAATEMFKLFQDGPLGVRDPIPAIACVYVLRSKAESLVANYGSAPDITARTIIIEDARYALRLSEAIVVASFPLHSPDLFAAAGELIAKPISAAEREKRGRYCVALAGEVLKAVENATDNSYVVQLKLGELLQSTAREKLAVRSQPAATKK